MVKNHLKRIAAPRTWNILRKAHTFISKPNSGAHKNRFGLSINTFLKEEIGIAKTTKEVKRIMREGEVLVDGKRRHDEKFNVGFMDVVSFPGVKKSYRVGLTSKGKLVGFEVKESEAKKKLVRVEDKKTIKKGKMQLICSFGRVLLVDKDAYKTGDSLLISLPEQKVEKHFAFAKGATVLVLEGKHGGSVGTIEKVEGTIVTVKTK